nr:gliding motility lipoprotein GldD [Eudoraea chungangensis]
MKIRNSLFFLFGLILFISCAEESLPKPKAMLRLEYPSAVQDDYNSQMYSFRYNALSKPTEAENLSLTLDYPMLKGTIFITYKEVRDNLTELLSDAQKLSYEHVVKADNITEQPFINKENKVYGMYYEVEGDAASQAQFYLTDSISHFVTGSVYFQVKPNYDSIYPAAVYLQKDIRTIMETLRWNQEEATK